MPVTAFLDPPQNITKILPEACSGTHPALAKEHTLFPPKAGSRYGGKGFIR